MISISTCTSSMSGTFSITDGESASRDAGMMATAAFLPPLTMTSPSRRAPPMIRSFSFIMPNGSLQKNR